MKYGNIIFKLNFISITFLVIPDKIYSLKNKNNKTKINPNGLFVYHNISFYRTTRLVSVTMWRMSKLVIPQRNFKL